MKLTFIHSCLASPDFLRFFCTYVIPLSAEPFTLIAAREKRKKNRCETHTQKKEMESNAEVLAPSSIAQSYASAVAAAALFIAWLQQQFEHRSVIVAAALGLVGVFALAMLNRSRAASHRRIAKTSTRGGGKGTNRGKTSAAAAMALAMKKGKPLSAKCAEALATAGDVMKTGDEQAAVKAAADAILNEPAAAHASAAGAAALGPAFLKRAVHLSKDGDIPTETQAACGVLASMFLASAGNAEAAVMTAKSAAELRPTDARLARWVKSLTGNKDESTIVSEDLENASLDAARAAVLSKADEERRRKPTDKRMLVPEVRDPEQEPASISAQGKMPSKKLLYQRKGR